MELAGGAGDDLVDEKADQPTPVLGGSSGRRVPVTHPMNVPLLRAVVDDIEADLELVRSRDVARGL